MDFYFSSTNSMDLADRRQSWFSSDSAAWTNIDTKSTELWDTEMI
jgi:hypothetical protein